MTKQDIATERLHNHRIENTTFNAPSEVVAWFGAVQAQDYAGVKWAIGLRCQNVTDADVERAIADGKIIRTWPMRGTIHFVTPEDVRWQLELLTPRVLARSAGRYRQLELDEAVFSKSRKVLSKALQGGKGVTRAALYEALEAAQIATNNGRGLHIMGHLAQQGLICFGPREGKQPTFVLLDEWVPVSRTLKRDEALTELTKRYFSSHGPATVQDFVWWSGLTVTETKVGLENAKSHLIQETIEGQTYWFSPNANSFASSSFHLLPWFDEFLVAYKDRSAVLEPSNTKQVNAGGGLLNPTMISNGQVVGVWKSVLKKDKVVLRSMPFRSLEEKEKHSLAVVVERYGTFLNKAALLDL